MLVKINHITTIKIEDLSTIDDSIVINMYKNKNFMGIFVTDVTDVKIMNDEFDSTRINVFLNITYSMILHGIKYDKNETLYGGKILNIDNDNIYIDLENCCVNIHNNKKLQFLKRGDIIPINCVESYYEPFDTEIIVIATPKIVTINNLKGITKIKNKKYYSECLSELEKTYKKLNNYKKKDINDVKKILYKYKKKITEPNNIISIKNIINNNENKIFSIEKPDYFEYGSDNIIHSTSDEKSFIEYLSLNKKRPIQNNKYGNNMYGDNSHNNHSNDILILIINSLIKELYDIIGFIDNVLKSPLKKDIINIYNDTKI